MSTARLVHALAPPLAYWVLSLGVGIRLERGGEILPIPMPYATLYERIPGFGALRVPARRAMLTHLALALLAGFALVHIGQWLRSTINHRLALITPAVIGTVALVEPAIFASSDEHVPGVLALGLIRRWEAEGARLYGFERTRYYPTLHIPQPGQVFDYGLLAADEDPLIYGFDTAGVRWRSNGLALYARDLRLRTAINLAQPVAGQLHPMYPAALTLTVAADRIHIHDKVFPLRAPLTAAAIEFDIASLVTQTLMIDDKAYTVPPGAVTIAAPVPLNRETAIIGQADRLSIQRLRVLSALRAPAPPPEGSLAISARCRFDGTRLLVTARIGGAGALALDVRGASARDDKPIHLLEGTPPAVMSGDGDITFSVDLIDPTEPWVTHRGNAEDGRYIVYLKSAGRPGAPLVPIATFSVRNGVISDAQPAPLPLRALR